MRPRAPKQARVHATQRRAADLLAFVRERRAWAGTDGLRWDWPADENPASRRHDPGESARLLAPFDPVAWDRTRFELLWGRAYRFEAYTPVARHALDAELARLEAFVAAPGAR